MAARSASSAAYDGAAATARPSARKRVARIERIGASGKNVILANTVPDGHPRRALPAFVAHNCVSARSRAKGIRTMRFHRNGCALYIFDFAHDLVPKTAHIRLRTTCFVGPSIR